MTGSSAWQKRSTVRFNSPRGQVTTTRLGPFWLLVVVASLVETPPATLHALQPVAQRLGDRSVLRYNPYALKDEHFAILAKVLADATPVELWPTIKVRSNEGLLGIVDRAYDFFLSSPEKYRASAAPQTALVLVEIIKKANKLPSDTLKSGQVLRIPPVPARPRSELAGTQATKAVHLTEGVEGEAMFYSDQGWHDRAAIGTNRGAQSEYRVAPKRWQVSDFNQLGIREVGEVSLSLPQTQAQFLAAAGVGTIVRRERVDVELLQSPECTTDFPSSPYEKLARLRLQQHLPRMTDAAIKTPLVLVDYDFERGHGAQVRKVVRDLLTQLGVPSLDRNVLDFDLNPRSRGTNNVQDSPLVKAMRDYTSYLVRLNADFADQRANASDWFLNPDDSLSGGAVVPIAPFALQAAVAVNLERGAWLNLSWRGGSADKVMPVELNGLLKSKDVFAVVAAGNEQADIMLGRSPQSEASSFSQFVNVTNGTPNGQVCGSRTSEQGGRVDLLSYGLSVDSQNRRVSGSSFASPVVATAAWLKHLLDGTPALGMRRELVSASSFLPELNTRTVAARGVFDPARLLARPGPHYIAADTGDPVEFKTMELDLGSCGSFRLVEETESINDLVIYERFGKHELAVRTATREFPHVKEREICEVQSLRFTVNLRSGGVRTATNPTTFLGMVRQLHF